MFRFKSIFPKVKAENENESGKEDAGELVDPQAQLRGECAEKSAIRSLYAKYQKCNDRVNSKKETAEMCTEEFSDYLHELDHCVSHSLWSRLK